MTFDQINKVYFIGIGGIGMSALARYFLANGKHVSGYDKTRTELTQKLEDEGIAIHYTDDISMVPTNPDLVVWTPAIPKDMKELHHVREQGYNLKKRAEVLGIISKSKKAIAVAGTHGKTSTSSLITHLLHHGGVDASAFLGGITLNFKSNYIAGNSDWVVEEADEYDRSFLHLHPQIAVVNSVDPDHLDIYGTHEKMIEAYQQFVTQIKDGGYLFYKAGLPFDGLLKNLQSRGVQTASFGYQCGDYRADNWHVADERFVFDIHTPKGIIKGIKLRFPGRYNMENATVATAAALSVGLSPAAIKKGLAAFKGVKRRFEYILRRKDVVYVDDYAHHPAELEAAISAMKMLYPDRKLLGVFQPHLFSRTRDFVEGFAATLDTLDECILLDIYPARELPMPGVTSAIIFDLMKNPNKTQCTKAELLSLLATKKFDALMTLGAGDIDTLVKPIKKQLSKR